MNAWEIIQNLREGKPSSTWIVADSVLNRIHEGDDQSAKAYAQELCEKFQCTSYKAMPVAEFNALKEERVAKMFKSGEYFGNPNHANEY